MLRAAWVSICAAVAILTAWSPSLALDGNEDVALVLDVSNSMWGQIDGTSKIEIARDVIADLIGGWDPDTALGLVAYGHRREGDCADIETVIPVGPVDPHSFVERVNALVPRGKTPLTDAVRQAADMLRFADRPATVILVSDGIETCNADPCALGEELERGGVAFTAHVIGFDVADETEQAQLRCLAENTGGRFLTASTADELATALTIAATDQEPDLTPAEVTLEAVAGRNGGLISEDIAWSVIDLGTDTTVLDADPTARPVLALAPGRYAARAAAGTMAGSAEFTVEAGQSATHRLVLNPSVTASLTVVTPEIVAGSFFTVTWEGPGDELDRIAVAVPGAQADRYQTYASARDGSPIDVRAPDEPGTYAIRYYHYATGSVLAEQEIDVLPASATLDAPAEVEAGSAFDVAWQGPDNQNDYVAIVAADAAEGRYLDYAYTRDGSPAEITAPDEPGTYEVRYVMGQSRATLVSRPITVTATSATLDAPAELEAGSAFDVAWQGPDNQNDYVTIVATDADEGQHLDYAYTRDGSPADITAPDEPGTYEVRYVMGQSRATLVSRPITVTATSATLDAPTEVEAGSAFDVAWQGPDNQNDYVTIVATDADEGQHLDYAYTRDGDPAEITAPDEPGTYEVRYVMGQSRATLVSRPITVTATSATLDVPAEVEAGSAFDVAWQGPDNQNDYVTIVAAEASEGQHLDYAYTRDGNPADITAPDEPGTYEVRYVMGQSRATLVSRPITVTATSATLDAPVEVEAGSAFDVAWQGPDNQNDYVTIVAADADEGQHLDYAYTRDGNPADITAPDEPGTYEIRYVMGQSRATLVSRPITVTATSATLDAPAEVEAGSAFDVAWDGPDNQNDYVTIVAADADEGQHLDYAYTREGSPADITAPDEPGTYEVRYVMGQSRATLVSRPITVTATSATLDAPVEVGAGSDFAVAWQGPDNQNDYVTIVATDADEGQHLDYAYTRNGDPAEISAPDEPGAYEVRYVMGQSRATLASRPITVTAVTAVVRAPAAIPARADFEVSWDGPANRNDYVAIATASAPDDEHLDYAYTRNGNPAEITAPDEPGTYEVRYVMGQSRTVIARQPIEVTAAK